MLLARLAQTAKEDCGLKADEPIIVGVSGGADSLALMYGLDSLGYKLVIAHLDHALRSESNLEAEFVRSQADSKNLPFYTRRVAVSQVAKAQGQSIEEAARHVRYQFLFEQARLQHCQAVAVAHHADDQVETVLMHFLRGVALPGLTGMTYRRSMPNWDPDIPLVRPLLATWRDEIEAYIDALNLTACVDHSNDDLTYHRNRIRHVLIPQLETYNPKIKKAIWQMADVLYEDAQYLDGLTEQVLKGCLQDQSETHIEIDRLEFHKLSTALKRRVFRQAIFHLRPDLRDIGFEVIMRGLAHIEDPPSTNEIDLAAQLNLAVFKDSLIIKNWHTELPDWGMPTLPSKQFIGLLDFENPLYLRHGWRIEASLLPDIPQEVLTLVKTLEPGEAWLDFDRVALPLTVRGRKRGERFAPLGMDGQTQKLQDYFVNHMIPVHLRDLWPLVISGEEVAWVVKLRPADPFRITEKTKRILRLKLIKPLEP
jgi:tRNA(Ile)-lysidine synthase